MSKRTKQAKVTPIEYARVAQDFKKYTGYDTLILDSTSAESPDHELDDVSAKNIRKAFE